MILEHLETGLLVRVIEDREERVVENANGEKATVTVAIRLVTQCGQEVICEPDGRVCRVQTNSGIVRMYRVS